MCHDLLSLYGLQTVIKQFASFIVRLTITLFSLIHLHLDDRQDTRLNCLDFPCIPTFVRSHYAIQTLIKQFTSVVTLTIRVNKASGNLKSQTLIT